MARIRTVKPEFWTDERTGQLSHGAKCFFIGLLNLSDDYGVVEYRPAEWAVKIFPYDYNTTPVVLQEWLVDEIMPAGLVEMFTYTDDEETVLRFLFIRGFNKHQVINKPSKPTLIDWKTGDTPKTYAHRGNLELDELSTDAVVTTTPLPECSGSTTSWKGKERKGEEGNNTPPVGPPLVEDKTENRKTNRGTRLPENWDADGKDMAYAINLGFTALQVERLLADFRDHFTNGRGRNETRPNWSGTWQRWCRQDIEYHGPPQARKSAGRGGGSGDQSMAAAIRDAGTRLRQGSRERGSGEVPSPGAGGASRAGDPGRDDDAGEPGSGGGCADGACLDDPGPVAQAG